MEGKGKRRRRAIKCCDLASSQGISPPFPAIMTLSFHTTTHNYTLLAVRFTLLSCDGMEIIRNFKMVCVSTPTSCFMDFSMMCSCKVSLFRCMENVELCTKHPTCSIACFIHLHTHGISSSDLVHNKDFVMYPYSCSNRCISKHPYQINSHMFLPSWHATL